MRRFILACVVLTVLWTVLVGIGARNGWLRPDVSRSGGAADFITSASAKFAQDSKGNIAIVLMEQGEPVQSYFAFHGKPVDEQTLFQAASMSKWLTAWGVMALAEEGRIDLDAPVSRYLTRWRLPPSAYDNEAVTVRRLLAHTSGLTDGLGFLGFAPGEDVPSLVQELTKTTDAMLSADGVVRVGAEPGSGWRYSGGGYLILQLLIEDVTQDDFNTYMKAAVLEPLGMSGSTFVDPDPERLADIFAADGTEATHYTFAATGAASLYTSAADLTAFLQAQVSGPQDAPAGRGVLTPDTLQEMGAPHAHLFGLPVWGLGVSLYAPNGKGEFVLGHDGENFPAINTTARIDPATGNGIIVLTTGSSTLARQIGGDWTFWQTGKVGLDTLIMFDALYILMVFAAGFVVIVFLTLAASLLKQRRVRRAA